MGTEESPFAEQNLAEQSPAKGHYLNTSSPTALAPCESDRARD